MVRILIFSDTHRRVSDMEAAVMQHTEADYLIHLGDCESDLEGIPFVNKSIKILSVPGNCDFGSVSEPAGEAVIDGIRIFYTHGHLYSAKFGTEKLFAEGKRRMAEVVLFGHTHRSVHLYENGIHIYNPGSISRPDDGAKSYGIMDIEKGQVFFNTVRL